MKARNFILALCVAFLFCGCAHPYVMKLSNGSQIVTASKPKLKGATYYFKDANGRTDSLPQSRVMVIEPASMAKQEASFKVHYPEPKRHWWQFWR